LSLAQGWRPVPRRTWRWEQYKRTGLRGIGADFGKKKGQSGYNPLADLNNDGVINILDLAIEARLLPKGTTCP
jgi:hypothetical protein